MNSSTTARTETTDLQKLIESIALEHLGIETLQTQNRDALDFHEVGVAALRAALLAAYEVGKAAGRQA